MSFCIPQAIIELRIFGNDLCHCLEAVLCHPSGVTTNVDTGALFQYELPQFSCPFLEQILNVNLLLGILS